MVLWLASCGLIGVPTASVEGVALTGMTLTEASMDVTVGVDNPMLVDLHSEGLRWSFDVGSQTVAKGTSSAPAMLAAGARSPITVPLTIGYADLWNAVGEGFSGSELPYKLSLELDAITPMGEMTLPLVYEGALPPLRAPSIDIVDLAWEVEADGRLRVDLSLKLGLPESFSLTRLDWTVDVDGRVLGSAAVDVRADGALRFPVRLDPRGAAEASWDWLTGSARELRLVLDGTVGTPLGTIPLATRTSLVLGEAGG